MKILEELKNKGYRITKPREELLKILDKYPLTVQEMDKELNKKNIHIDLASIYRSLELFVNMGIVHVIELGEDKKRYELVNDQNHHHHLVCNRCGTIEDIEINEKNLLQEVQKKTSFKIDHHHLEFFGICMNCHNK